MSSALDLARKYTAAGISVLPIRPDGTKSPASEGLIKGSWKYLQQRPMTDEELVHAFSGGNGIAAVGGRVSGNLEDFDFDDLQTYRKWKRLVIELLGQSFWDKLLVVGTPRPGAAVIIRCADGVGPSQKLAWEPGIDKDEPDYVCVIETKGEGGYFLLPGCPAACHATGRIYEIVQGDFDHIPEISGDQREVLLTCARSLDLKPREEYSAKSISKPASDSGLLPGNDYCVRGPAWDAILEPHNYKLHSQRGDVSHWTRPGKEHGVSASTNHNGSDLFYPFSTNCDPFDSGRGYNKFAVYALLNHGGDFSAAARQLLREGYGTPPKTRPRASKTNRGANEAPSESPDVNGEDATADADRPTKYSDDALAHQFSARYSEDFKYVESWGWLQWTGQRWKRIPDVVVMDRARLICRLNAKRCETDSEISLSEKGREALARTLASARVVAAVVKLAKGDKRHYSEVSEWDSHAWLFNTPGGTIELKTGKLREHRRDDRITKIARSSPKGDCPQWTGFLARITNGNGDLQAYLQRLAGYAMCGDPSEECLDFFYGEGGNGKGSFLKTVQHIFGEYSTTAATETFMESRGEKHPTDVAKLAGARLVVAQEVNEGQHWNESRLKTMTGRDELTARFMRRDLFDFAPEFTLIISGNNKPALKSVDKAWRRRFHVVPFEVCIPKEEQNPNLKTELLAESDGILNWCLAGCLEWQQQRLNPPEVVLTATADYLSSEDTLEMWLQECCLSGQEAYEEPSSYLYASYRRWKESRGEKAPGTKTFSQRLIKHGLRPGKDATNTVRVFHQVRLTDGERNAVNALIDTRKRWEQGDSGATAQERHGV